MAMAVAAVAPRGSLSSRDARAWRPAHAREPPPRACLLIDGPPAAAAAALNDCAPAVATVLALEMKRLGSAIVADQGLLHVAAEHQTEPAVWDVLLAALPADAARRRNVKLQLPLHCACSLLAAQRLLVLYPEAVQVADADGALPVHHAAGAAATECLELLLQKHPSGAAAGDRHGWLPLHYAAASTRAEVLAMLDGAPAANCEGFLPLHCAVIGPRHALYGRHDPVTGGSAPAAEDPPLPAVIEMLLQTHEPAANVKVRELNVLHLMLLAPPAHWSPQTLAAAVRALLARSPALVTAPYPSGHTILAVALKIGHALPVIRELLEAHPEAASQPSAPDEPRPFLSLFGTRGKPFPGLLDTAAYVLAACPAAATDADPTPALHKLLSYASGTQLDDTERDSFVALVQALLAAHPDAAATADGHDQLPLHLAAGLGCLPLVETLLTAHPAAAAQPNVQGARPLHMATTHTAEGVHIVRALLAADISAATGAIEAWMSKFQRVSASTIEAIQLVLPHVDATAAPGAAQAIVERLCSSPPEDHPDAATQLLQLALQLHPGVSAATPGQLPLLHALLQARVCLPALALAALDLDRTAATVAAHTLPLPLVS